jgi:hypothetical protein
MHSDMEASFTKDRDIWEHEIKAVKVLLQHGYSVRFLPKDQRPNVKTADLLLNGVPFELKSPRSDKLSAIERNLKRASHQSENIIIDSRRMKGVKDDNIKRYLIIKLKTQRTIKKLLFITKKGRLLDINQLV